MFYSGYESYNSLVESLMMASFVSIGGWTSAARLPPKTVVSAVSNYTWNSRLKY